MAIPPPPAGQTGNYSTPAAMTHDPSENCTSNGVAVVPDQDVSPLLKLPRETVSHIVGYLSLRDIMAVGATCRYLNGVAASVLTDKIKQWFKQFEPSQQQQFIQIAKNIGKHQLRAWLMQFTRNQELISRLCRQSDSEEADGSEARSQEKIPLFPQELFYRVGLLMIDSPALHPVLVADIKCQSYDVHTATLSHDASYLATNCYRDCNARIHVLAGKNFGCLEIPIPHKGWLRQATLSPDNRHILSYCAWRMVKITSLISDSCWAEQFSNSYEDDIRSTSFSPDSCHVVTACGKNAYIYSADQAGCWAPTGRIAHDGYMCSAEFSPDSSMVVTASDYTIKIDVRAANGEWLPIAALQHSNEVISAKFSPDNKHILTISRNQNGEYGQTATIFSVNPDGRWTKKVEIAHSDRICLADFSPNSRHAVTASRDHTGAICSFDPNNNLWQRNGDIRHTDRVTAVRFSPNSLAIISASDDHSAKVYGFDADQKSWSERLTINQDELSSVLFSADNRHILTLSRNDISEPDKDCKAIIISRDADGKWRANKIIRSKSGVYSGQFNHDGSHVAIIDCEGKVLVLGCGTDGEWHRKAVLKHSYSLKSAEFSANSSHLVTISHKGKRIKVWRLCGVEPAPAPSTDDNLSSSSILSPSLRENARR